MGISFVNSALAGTSPDSRLTELSRGWRLRSSCAVQFTGEQISSLGFPVSDWLPISVPSTVLGAQVEAGLFPNPFFGSNLRNIPGTDYPLGRIYANLPMTDSSPYRCSWWYRIEFDSRPSSTGFTRLRLDGINYRANIWLNGKQITTKDEIAGPYRQHFVDISSHLSHSDKNALAIEVFAQTENDLGINFVDWNHAPADKSMGLWRNVYLQNSGPVTLQNPAVFTRFVNDRLSAAKLTVVADLKNVSSHEIRTVVRGNIGMIRFEQAVALAADQQTVIRFDPKRFPQLHIRNPKVWWPAQYGSPNLSDLNLSVIVNGRESDSKSIRFGIREIDSDLNDQGYRQFRVNRRNILIRGAGWAPDMFYREPRKRLRQELEYVKHLNLNAIRLEGKLGSSDLFDLADQMGILIMAGWSCCDQWERWEKWTARDHEIATRSLYSQISRLRSHPSVFVWLNGSDNPPTQQVEHNYLDILHERDWPNPVLSSATARTSTGSPPTGVKMTGPYDYVPPEYWYLDKNKFGGAYGFNTESGPGPAIPSADIIRRTLPTSSWWPQDDLWNFHAAIGKFAQYNIFNAAMSATYGEPADLLDYTRKAQLMAYDGERAMFEAYSARKYNSTGVIQWMLNNAWPSFTWHLYDYYLVPGGGYFGTRKANEPLHIQYSYDDRRVVVVNSTLQSHLSLAATARVFALDGTPLFNNTTKLALAPDGVNRTVAIPEQHGTTFLKLELRNKFGKLLSSNFYWVPEKLADLDWGKSTYFYTPATRYADMHDLSAMPAAIISAGAKTTRPGQFQIQLENPGPNPAFFLHLRAVKSGSDEEFGPVLWDDNFISLMPRETRTLTATLPSTSKAVRIRLDGWNVPPQELRPR